MVGVGHGRCPEEHSQNTAANTEVISSAALLPRVESRGIKAAAEAEAAVLLKDSTQRITERETGQQDERQKP